MTDDMDYEDDGPPKANFLVHLPIILWERRWFLIIPAVLCSIAGLVAAFVLPLTYRASAVLLVEAQQLPPELVGATAGTVIDKRIARMREQVLSRPDLMALIEKNELYLKERRKQPLSVVVEMMRDATTITPVAAATATDDKGSKTVAFQLTYDYSDPAKAKFVTQEFVDRLLRLDATQTATLAAGTVDFLQAEANGLTKQIADVERKIEAIKANNGLTLSNAGTMMMVGGGGYDAQIATLQRENTQLKAQLTVTSGATRRDPAVVAAEAALANAKAIYSDSHPDVRLAEIRLAEAKKASVGNTDLNVAASAANSQIAANNSMIETLTAAKARDASRASSVVAAQSRAPLVGEQVAQLQAKADQLRLSYQGVANNLMNARATVRMDTEQKGERLSVIDPAQVSDQPLKPNRLLVLAGGVLGGLMLGFVCAMVVEFLRRPVRGVDGVASVTGVVPLVVVPTLGSGRHRWPLFGLFGKRQRLA